MSKWRNAETTILNYMTHRSLSVGAKLPSNSRFAEMTGCSLQPVVRAMEELERKGLVRRRAGAATEVASQQPFIDNGELSFSVSSTTLGQKLINKILELSCRLPNPGDQELDDHRAQKVLGLKKDQPFYSIKRLRILDDKPRAIHQSYLNPAHYPATFLADHNFEKESLIAIFNHAGFRIESRRTTLQARFPTTKEKIFLNVDRVPVLDAEQELVAVREATKEPVHLEFLRACYHDWNYRIEDRLANRPNE